MKDLTIKRGSKESSPYTLAHWKLGAVFVPATEDDLLLVEVLGSHDGIDYGRINDGLIIPTAPKYTVRTFDPQIFEGIQYIKLALAEPYNKDLEFFIHLKDT